MTNMSVAAAVGRDLNRLPPDLAESGLAATALTLARKLDEGVGSPSECAKALTSVLMALRDLAPEDEEADPLDDLQQRFDRGAAAEG